jgi:hypothetical protein
VKRSRSILAAALGTGAIAAATVALVMSIFAGVAVASPKSSASQAGAGTEVLHSIHTMKVKGACHHNCGGGGNNLSYHGGTSDGSAGTVGVETGADKVYLVYWGSQWTNNDPSGEAAIQQSFFNHVGGSAWNNSVTQYCEGVASGTITCGSSGTHATNPTGVLAGVWYDNGGAAPSSPSQSPRG